MFWRALSLVSIAATLYSVSRVGTVHAVMFAVAQGEMPPSAAVAFWPGLWYALPLMAILLIHEYGHILAAKRHGVKVAGPFFLPWPPAIGHLAWFPMVGTLGAFVRLRSPMSPLAQWDIAASGLLAGAFASFACVLAGAALSVEVPAQAMGHLWEPLIVRIVTSPETAWHPLLTAGWVGCCVTVANMLLIWPLDGWRMLCAVDTAWRERRWSLAASLLVGVGCLG